MADAPTQQRLGDIILSAMNMALDQKDLAIAEVLSKALDLAMTRNAGGKGFVERRDFSDEVVDALTKLQELKKSSKA